MTGRGMEIVKVMKARKIQIMCVQETKWKGENSHELGEGYKIIYNGTDSKRNGVGIILDPGFKTSVVDVVRQSDRIILCKMILTDKLVVNVISAYAPQVGCNDEEKESFYRDLDNLVAAIPNEEKLVIGADMNSHVGKSSAGYPECHGGRAYGRRNEAGETFLEWITSHNLWIANTWFIKRDEHLITYKSGPNKTQIDYFILKETDKRCCLDCKVIPGDPIAEQHRLLVADLKVVGKRSRQVKLSPKIKWYYLQENPAKTDEFKAQVETLLAAMEQCWETHSCNDIWADFQEKVLTIAEEVLGKTRGGTKLQREAWWWNDTVQNALKEKKVAFKVWQKDRTPENHQAYKEVKRQAQRTVRTARDQATERWYEELTTREGEAKIFKIAKNKAKLQQDLGAMLCIKDEQGTVLTRTEDIVERWRTYFREIMNEGGNRQPEDVEPPVRPVQTFSEFEVEQALKKMARGKSVGPDGLPIEIFKVLGRDGIIFMHQLANKIMAGDPMPNAWRESTTVPIYKRKGDVQQCNNYRPIKLMSHCMKWYERLVETRLRNQLELDISENQLGFMKGRGTTDGIYAVRQMLELYREGQIPFHYIFVDLEKAYDRIPRSLIWECLAKRGVAQDYVRAIKDMYEGCTTRVRSAAGQSEDFTVQFGLHQGSALSPFLFIIIMDTLTKDIQGEAPDSLLFADDIVIKAEDRREGELKLNKWVETLEMQGLKVNRAKTEYMECVKQSPGTIKIGNQELNKVKKFKYLGSTIEQNGGCEEDVKGRIKAGWAKFRDMAPVLTDKKMPKKLKGRIYKQVVRPCMLYGSECWAVRKREENLIHVAEMRMLRRACGVTLRDHRRNEDIRLEMKTADVTLKMRERRLSWWGHVQRRDNTELVKRINDLAVPGRRQRGRPKQTLSRKIAQDMSTLSLTQADALNRAAWKTRCHAADPP